MAEIIFSSAENTNNNPELSQRRQTEIAQLSTALITRKVRETQTALRDESKEAQAQFFNDNPAEAVLQVMDMMANPAVESYEWENSEGEPAPAAIPGNKAEIILPEGAIAGHETKGRRAQVSKIKSVNGDQVVCIIEVKSDDGQVAIPPCEFSLSRDKLFLALLGANQKNIVGLFPETQQQAIQEHFNLLQGNNQLTDTDATALIETAAQEAGFITKKQWQSYLEKTLPVAGEEPKKPPDDADEEKKAYDEKKQAYDKAVKVRDSVLKDFESRCGDQVLLDPTIIVDVLRTQIDPEEKSGLQKQRAEVQQEIEAYQQQLEALQKAKKIGKTEVTEEINGQKITRMVDVTDRNQLTEEIKELEIRLEFSKKYQAAIDTLVSESGSEKYLETYFEKLQQGEIDTATAKEIASLIAGGDIDKILQTIEQQVLEQLGKTKGDLNEQQNLEIQKALERLEQIKKLKNAGKNTGKIAGIGLAAFLLIIMMQGMGGGGGGGQAG